MWVETLTFKSWGWVGACAWAFVLVRARVFSRCLVCIEVCTGAATPTSHGSPRPQTLDSKP